MLRRNSKPLCLQPVETKYWQLQSGRNWYLGCLFRLSEQARPFARAFHVLPAYHVAEMTEAIVVNSSAGLLETLLVLGQERTERLWKFPA